MHKDLDLRRIYVKEPLGFDHLKPLVDERGGVDSDLGAHCPCGMPKRVLRGHFLKILRFFASEGSAGSGQPDLGDLIAVLSVERLEDRAVLAVNREDRNALARG